MEWAELARRAPPWAESPAGPFRFVLLTRLFSYRNFSGEPFPVSASREALASVTAKALPELAAWGLTETFRLADLPVPVLRMLQERGLLADPSLPLRGRKEFKRLALPPDAAADCAWLHDVEHLTFAQTLPGLLSREFFPDAYRPPREDAAHHPWAWSPRYGYLSSDPARIGCGFAAEILAHLPALALSRRLGHVHNAMAALGLAFAPVTRVETGESDSALFRFRSGGTLGVTAGEAYGNFLRSVEPVFNLEAEAQRRLVEKHRKRLEDRVEGSLRVLSEARGLSYPSFLSASSFLRLGAYAGILKPQIPTLLEELRTTAQTGHLQVIARAFSTKEEEDIARANVVRLALERVLAR